MKNFEQILSDAGVELTDEQKTAINKEMGENYKPVADWQKQVDKVQNLTEQLDSTKDALKKSQIATVRANIVKVSIDSVAMRLYE